MICNKITAGNIYINIIDHLPNFIFMEIPRKKYSQDWRKANDQTIQ